jgi:tetratricopeptide (TPR) repeat protein
VTESDDRRERPNGSGTGSGSARGGAGRASGAPSSRHGAPAGRGAARGPGGNRSGDRPVRPRLVEPPLPDDVTGSELDRSVRAELGSLASMNADAVAKHLVMAGRLLDEDPETAYQHTVAARNRAGRIGAVREAAGIAAYLTGRYAEALAELRAARRISGDQSLLPVMADCERGLGRPEKALAMASAPEVRRLDASGRAEMLIVASGARRDLGQPEAAALLLQGPELSPGRRKAWSARLFYAYAEALLASGRTDEATAWFGHAADADANGETDADERLAELQGVGPLVLHDDEDDGPG